MGIIRRSPLGLWKMKIVGWTDLFGDRKTKGTKSLVMRLTSLFTALFLLVATLIPRSNRSRSIPLRHRRGMA